MKKQNLLLIISCLLLLVMSVGYSVFKVTTTVQGKTAIVSNLDVEFESIGKIEEKGSTDANASISEDKKTVTINVPKLAYKGSYAIIPIKLRNTGTLPAKLDSIYEYGTNDNNAIKISYNGIGVTDKKLMPNDEVLFTVKVLYENDIENGINDLEFYIKFDYVQG